jgi:uncharacterized membrane protein
MIYGRFGMRHKWMAACLLGIAIAAAGCSGSGSGTEITESGDLIITESAVTEKAKFIPVTVEGVDLEVIAVKAPDGTIRTAFNTCQVCYDSGRGYYVQEDKQLVCQNCGNRFTMDKVEKTAGGCNPFPIFDSNKTVEDGKIKISAEFLQEAKVIFENWKA